MTSNRAVCLLWLLICLALGSGNIWGAQAHATPAVSKPFDEDLIRALIEEAGRPETTAKVALARSDAALRLLDGRSETLLEIGARLARSEARAQTGDYVGSLEDAQRAEQLASDMGEKRLLARSLYQAAAAHRHLAEYEAALSKAHDARDIQERLIEESPPADLVRTLMLIGAIHQLQNHLDVALEHYLSALRLSESRHDQQAVARAHNNIGLIYWEMGKHQAAYQELLRALELHEEVGPERNVGLTSTNIGLVLVELDRPAEALEYLASAMRMDEAQGDLYGQAKNLANQGFAYEKLNQFDTALEHHHKALELRRQIGDKDGELRSSSVLAMLLLQSGDVAGAIAMLRPAIDLAVSVDSAVDEVGLQEMLAQALERQGNLPGALKAFWRFHELDSQLKDEAARRHLHELDVRYQTVERERSLASVAERAESQRRQLQISITAAVLLGASVVLMALLFYYRARSRRALMESEQRYRAIFETSALPTLLVEIDSGRVIDFNPAAAKLCDNMCTDPAMNVTDLEPAWVRKALEPLLHLQGENDVQQEEDTWVEQTGRQRWTEVGASSVAVDGRACKLVRVRDITELHRAEEERLKADRMDALGTLAGGIAHDFNNILTGIGGHIGLARTYPREDQEEMLDGAEQAVGRAAKLAGQLLAFSRGGRPVRRLVDVGALLQDALTLAGSGTHLGIQVTIADDLLNAEVDPGQFNQVVSNLVIHAQKTTPRGGGLVIRASNEWKEIADASGVQPFVRIDFSDTGAGVSEEVREHIFDPYFAASVHEGGLGLASAFAICRNHGGMLSLESTEGSGSTFSVHIPASTESLRTNADDRPVVLHGQGTILVLEDEPLIQHLFQRMLEQCGYAVEVVGDGAQAVERYLQRLGEGRPFDLLIMDLTIPGGVGGREAMSEILADDPNACGIVVSGYSDDPTMARYEDSGFRAALAKPFQREDLVQAVSSVLKAARARAQRDRTAS